MDLDAIKSALEAREFFLVYQPILFLRDGLCFGAEALIRWRRGNVVLAASEFIPLSDRTPLSGVLTYWVMETVAAELGDWLDSNGAAHISVNVPPEILGRGGLEYAATKSGLRARAKQLILEVTERGIPDQLGLDALNSIPGTGAQVALDDTTLSARIWRCSHAAASTSSRSISCSSLSLLPTSRQRAGWRGLRRCCEQHRCK